MIRRLLRTVGLVTSGELSAAEEKVRATRQRLDKTAERLAQVTAASQQARNATREDARRHKARVAQLESEHQRLTAQHREAARAAARRISALEDDVRARDLDLEASLREETRLEQVVAAAQQELVAARAALMTLEVKLDILEGAANVLDRRTRPAPPTAGGDVS